MTANPTGPFTVVAGGSTELQYPQGSSPQAAVVIDNLSPFALQVSIATGVFWLPPFQENVYLLPQNRSPVRVAAFTVPGTPPGISIAGVLATWYAPGDPLPGGTWPMALTGAAIEASLATAGLAGVDLVTVTGTVASLGADTPAFPDSISARLWNWGFALTDGETAPTDGFLQLGVFGTGAGIADDTVGLGEGASNRLAGLAFNTQSGGAAMTVSNLTDQEVTFFISYSKIS